MPTTVRVEDEVKADLDRLQGYLQSESGERLSHSELLRRLLAVGRRHEAELFEREPRAWKPPTREQLEILFAPSKDIDVETDSSRIDEFLYGEQDP